MKILPAIGLLFLLQDKPSVTLISETPTENAWPISGRLHRPDGTVVRVSALRVERRWEPAQERFRELTSAGSRLMKSAEVDGRSFRANLKRGPAGLYEVAVAAEEQKLHAERMLLGSPAAMFAATRKALPRMTELCDRAAANLDEIQKVLAGKQPGSAASREAFIKKVHADELMAEEFSAKTDLTASATLLGEICSQIRNAQVWELSAARSLEEQNNDAQNGSRDIFLDPKQTFQGLHATIEAARSVISREMTLSAASMLSTMFARAEEREKALQRAKDIAGEALKLLALAPVEDKEARPAFEAAAGAEASGIAEVRKGLQALIDRHRAEP